MSHKATNWLANLAPETMTAGAFRVMFHLCDCHNPSNGCFPAQAYLMDKCNLSNSGLNLILKRLENDGLISRHQRVDAKTRKKRPTRYLFPFEEGFKAQNPTPESGDGKEPNPTPESGVGSISTFRGKPSPLSGQSHLHRGGDKPVKEPVINQRACALQPGGGSGRRSQNPLVQKSAERAVAQWRDGRTTAFDDLQPWERDHIIASGLLSDDELAQAGFSNEGGKA